MKRWLLACLSMLCMVALLVGCGNDTAKDGKQGKHMNVGLYWFGETLDPTHEWDAWTLTRIGAGETLAVVTPDMKSIFYAEISVLSENLVQMRP